MSRSKQNRFDLLFHVSQQTEQPIRPSVPYLAEKWTTDSPSVPICVKSPIRNLNYFKESTIYFIDIRLELIVVFEAQMCCGYGMSKEKGDSWWIFRRYSLRWIRKQRILCTQISSLHVWLTYLLYRCAYVIWSPAQLSTCLIPWKYLCVLTTHLSRLSDHQECSYENDLDGKNSELWKRPSW